MKLLAIFIVAALLFAGCLNFGQPAQQGKTNEVNDAPANITAAQNNSAKTVRTQYVGPMPEGVKPVYLDFNPDEFSKSLAEKKVVFLEFFSPESTASVSFEPQIYGAFSQIANDNRYANVIGFRVVLEERPELAQQYGVGQPNTHIIIGRDGSVVLKETGEWDKQRLIDSIGQAS